jgi:hypothetical protein
MAVVAARVADCPRSRAVGLTEIVADDRAGFTVTVAGADATMTGVLELSVTWSSNDHVPTVVKVPVEMDADDVHAEEPPRLVNAVAPGAFSSHWQE